MEPFVRNPYNYDMDLESKNTGLECKDPTLAQQSFMEECDINTIVERFHLTGEMPQLTGDDLPMYQNYEGIFDFQTAMNAVRQAEESFMELPAKVRARFNNQPQAFLEFCENAENIDEARKLGILRNVAPDQQPEMKTNGPQIARPPQSNAESGPGTSGTAPSQSPAQPTQAT